MLRKLSFGTGNVNKEKVKSLKQTTLTSKSLSSAPDDDLDDVAVISNPTQVTYGSSRGSITAINGRPKVVPGIITSSGTGLIIQKPNQFEPNQFKGGSIKYSSSIFNQAHFHSNVQNQETTSPRDQLIDNELEQDIEKSINNKLEQKRLFDQFNQLEQNQPAQMALLNRLGKKQTSKEDNLEQTDLDTLERDSKQDYDESELDESDEQTQSESNDELDDEDLHNEDINDDELDKDYRFLKKKFKNHYTQHKHLLPSANFADNQPPIQQPQKTMNPFSDQTSIPISSILPHYIPSNHFLNSAANSDKLSNSDNRLNKKTNDLRKNDFKREYQRLDNQTYMMHSPSMNTSNANSSHLNANEKSGCNLSFVFDPSGRLCYFWEMIVSLGFLYNFWVIIYRFSFEEITTETMAIWFTIDFLADFVYVIDIGVHLRIAYLDEGVLQTDTKKLRQHYMNSTMFYIDCLCILPADILYLSVGFNSILRCFRLIKIYRFLSFLDRSERHSNYPNLFRTLTLTHYILAIFHWNACVYHMIAKRGVFGVSEWFSGSKDETEGCSDVRCDYLHAFYWSTLALTLTGDLPKPKTKPEYIFLILELVFGLLLTSVVLGHVSNIVTNVSAARKEFQARLDAVKTFMRIRRVPEHLKIKVIKWFDYLWMTKKSSDDECVGFLPAKLKAEIAIHVHLDTLKRVEIFQNTEAGFLCALVLRLKPILFSPGDYVCRKGEIGKEMYIVSRGKLQVVADGGKTVLATLRAGSYFGEISILNMGTAGNRRTASVRSVGYSDLFCLSKQVQLIPVDSSRLWLMLVTLASCVAVIPVVIPVVVGIMLLIYRTSF